MKPNNNQMQPGDNKNLIIFMLVSVMLYFIYDTFILSPHADELRAIKAQQAQTAAIEVPGGPAAINNAPQEIKSVAEALSQSQNIALQNGSITGSVSLTGGQLNNITLNDFYKTLDKKENVQILAPQGTQFPRSIEYGWVSADTAIKLPTAKTIWTIAGASNTLTQDTPVTIIWNNGQGLRFERTLSIDDAYAITIQQNVVNNSGKQVTLFPYGLLSQKGIPADHEDRFISHEGPIAYAGGELEEHKYKKLRKEGRFDFDADNGWIGTSDKYWLTALIPPQGQQTKFRMHYVGTPPKKKQPDTGRYQADFTGAAVTIAAGQSASVESHAFIGPKRVIMLKEYSKKLGVPKLDLAVDFGIFWFFTIPFFYALHYIGLFVGNMGVAIIILTLIIRTMASPLTYTSYKSFAKMKMVMPQVNALKEKHGDDKQAVQKEMMALYQREGVNPAAGCVPILLQIPIFFAFYKILFITIEVRHEPFFGWIHDLAAADPTSIFNLFGLIPWDPPSFLMIGVWPVLMLVAMQIQRKLNPPPTDAIQRDMAKWFPFMMTFIMAQFASGLVIYWTVSAFFGVAQQMFIMRKMGVPIHLLGETTDEELVEAKAGKNKDEPIEGDYEVVKNPDVIKDIKPPKPKPKKKKKK